MAKAKRKPVPFQTGRVAITHGAVVALAHYDKWMDAVQASEFLLARHLFNDWGDLDAHDRHANDLAVRRNGRLLSSYDLKHTVPHERDRSVWIITEADRSATTILLPSEY
jgi:hypothetical protein